MLRRRLAFSRTELKFGLLLIVCVCAVSNIFAAGAPGGESLDQLYKKAKKEGGS